MHLVHPVTPQVNQKYKLQFMYHFKQEENGRKLFKGTKIHQKNPTQKNPEVTP